MNIVNKTVKYDFCDFEPNERLMRQRKLVELSSILFPEKIKKLFETHSIKNKDNGSVQSSNITLDWILKGSRFLQEKRNRISKENSIFDNIKDLDKYIKPVSPSSLF